MALWSNNQEDLTQKTGVKEKIEENGVYEVEIKEAYISNSTKSKSQAVTIVFEDNDNYGRVNFWYLKSDGTENRFAVKSLNRLLYLCKLKSENLKQESRKVKLFSGEEVQRVFLPDLEEKKIGIILEVKIVKDNVNYEVKDFFDLKTRKTSDEIINKTEAATVEFFKNKYEKEALNKPKNDNEDIAYDTDKNITTVTSLDDDEFPF